MAYRSFASWCLQGGHHTTTSTSREQSVVCPIRQSISERGAMRRHTSNRTQPLQLALSRRRVGGFYFYGRRLQLRSKEPDGNSDCCCSSIAEAMTIDCCMNVPLQLQMKSIIIACRQQGRKSCTAMGWLPLRSCSTAALLLSYNWREIRAAGGVELVTSCELPSTIQSRKASREASPKGNTNVHP